MNRTFAELNKPAFKKPPDVPFEQFCGGSSNSSFFPKHSRRRARKARSVTQYPDDPERRPVGIRGWNAPIVSVAHIEMAKASLGRSLKESKDQPSLPTPENGVLVSTLGE